MTTTRARRSGQNDPERAFRYGWREVWQTDARGRRRWVRLPLTLTDVLHPEIGDVLNVSDSHERRCRYLWDVFEECVVDDPTAVVLHDVRIAWDRPGLRPHSPDLSVIFGVRQRQDWATFDVVAEGTRPSLIVEVTSPGTARVDRVRKVAHYALVGVPYYVIVDAVSRRRGAPPTLLGLTLTPNGYVPLEPDASGRLWLPPVRCWLGLLDDEIACFDSAGQRLGNHATLRSRLTAEHQARLRAEQQITAEHQARLQAEQQITAEHQARLQAEQHAAAEHQARLQAERRLRELEATLRQPAAE